MSTSIELTKISSYLTEDYINKHLTKWFREETQYTGHEVFVYFKY